MQPKRKAVAAIVAGTVLGGAGLVFIAMPAGADESPALPPISAEELAQSVTQAQIPALNGTIKVDNDLGLPSVPGMGTLSADTAQVWSDGQDRSRLALRDGNNEQTVVRDGAAVWQYNSSENTVTKLTLPPEAVDQLPPTGQDKDPVAATAELFNKLRETSTLNVDGTAKVAGRAAYEVVLTPKPTERTVLREVRVAVDAEKRLPLRLSVFTNGTNDPAFQVSFSDLSFAEQPAHLFQFTPPQGAKVTEQQIEPGTHDEAAKQLEQNAKFVGDGWDTVVTGQIPADMPLGKQGPNAPKNNPGADEGSPQFDPKALLGQIGKPISGAFGNGHLITTKVGNALITDDGRFAAGAVPEQVLIEALGTK